MPINNTKREVSNVYTKEMVSCPRICEGPPNKSIGIKTEYKVYFGPKTVCLNSFLVRENVPARTFIWPNGWVQSISAKTSPSFRIDNFPEGNSVIDTVSPSFYHIDQIYNASTGEHEDFTRETELLLEWQNPDTGEWVPFDTPKFNSEFNGSCIICLHKFQTRTSREGVWSPWKGPWQQVQVLYQ